MNIDLSGAAALIGKPRIARKQGSAFRELMTKRCGLVAAQPIERWGGSLLDRETGIP